MDSVLAVSKQVLSKRSERSLRDRQVATYTRGYPGCGHLCYLNYFKIEIIAKYGDMGFFFSGICINQVSKIHILQEN